MALAPVALLALAGCGAAPTVTKTRTVVETQATTITQTTTVIRTVAARPTTRAQAPPSTPGHTTTHVTSSHAVSPPPPNPGLAQVATAHASGSYAVAQASGDVNNVTTIQLHLLASPPQDATVSWDMVCQESGGGAGSKSGQADLHLPTTHTLPLPGPSHSCAVSANAQLSGSGTVRVSIYG